MPPEPSASDSTHPSLLDAHSPVQGRIRATVEGSQPERRARRASTGPIIEGSYLPPSVLLGGGWPERDADALRGDMEAIGRDFRKAFEPFVEQVRAQVLGTLLPFRCALCAERFPKQAEAEAHLSAGHSRWERVKHWADEHPVKLWLTFWAVLIPATVAIVVIFP